MKFISKNTVRNASDILEAIRRDVISSDIWEKYTNTLNFESYKYRYDATRNNYSIADGGRDMYDRGNRVSTKQLHVFLYDKRFQVFLIYSKLYLLKVSFSVINGAHSYSENTTIYGELYR